MIKGLFFSENGDVQQIGEISSAAAIIAAIETVLPQLKEQHTKAILDTFTEEDLMRVITQRKADLSKSGENKPAKVA